MGALFFWDEYKHVKKRISKGTVHFSFMELIMYRMDYHFSSSESAMALLLMGLTFSLILIATFFLCFVTGEGVGNSMWNAWIWIVDNGSHGDVEGVGKTIIAWCTTVAGMIVFAMFIGIVSDTIQETLESFRKGRCRVIESGHTVMLGWNTKSMSILEQIALANKSEGGGTIAVLCGTNKEDMEQLLAGTIEEGGFDLHGTNVVFRTGDPLNTQSLAQISASSARAILIMSREDLDSDDADALTVRQILVVKSLAPLSGHVVAEMCRVDNLEWVAMVDEEGLVEPIVPRNITGRILVQSSRVPGLGHVMDLLMAFDASSFYHQAWPQLEGKAFGDIARRFDGAVVMGLIRAGEGDGLIKINPPSDTVICPGDEVLVVAEDNNAYTLNGAEPPDDGALLLVKLEEGENFPKLDLLDESDPFVTLHLPGAGEVQRTSTKKNSGAAPKWGEAFQLSRRPDQPRLVVTAYDEDTLTCNSLIGTAEIDLAPLAGALGRPHEAWHELEGGAGGRDKAKPARVRLTMTLFSKGLRPCWHILVLVAAFQIADSPPLAVCEPGLPPLPEPREHKPEKHAWIGWRRDMTDMVKDLDTWVRPP
jgi:Trk K+ transport system NAD-binding subunit